MLRVHLNGLWQCFCPRFSCSWQASTRALQAVISVRQYQSIQQRYEAKPYDKQDLGVQDVYEELRVASKKGQHGTVQKLVRLLLIEHNEKPNQQMYHALMLANVHPEAGSAHAVSSLLIEMVDQDITPDAAIYHAALKALAIHPDYVLRKDILEELHQRWFTLTTEGWHDVILGLIRDRQVELAMNHLESLRKQGVPIQSTLFDTIVYTLCSIEEFDEAMKLMQHRMASSDALISPILWAHFLDECSRSLHHPGTQLAWRCQVQQNYLNPSSGMCINILNTAVRHGDVELATDVFRTLEKRKQSLQPHHYEAVLESWLASSNVKAAFTVLCAMASAGMQPPEASTRAIYIYLAVHKILVKEALKVLHVLVDSGSKVPHAAINVIIEAYIHHSDLASAIETYQTLHTIVPSGPNTATFNALIRGCADGNRKDLAMFFASEMLALKIPPNALTYDRLILTCLDWATQGEDGFEDAWKYFEEMRNMGWWPRAGTLKELAINGCLLGDKRVDALVNEERGLDEQRLQYFVWMYWGKRRREIDPQILDAETHQNNAVTKTLEEVSHPVMSARPVRAGVL